MSELYRLVFRGEVLQGQHPAVVRKRLAQAAAFDEALLDRLFSGRPVVLKREADRPTAARFQVLFKNAGARLRVLPVTAEAATGAAQSGDQASAAGESFDAAPAAAHAPADGAFELLPAGADVLRADERAPWRPRDIDTAHLSLAKAQFFAPEAAEPEAGPDVSHLTLAELGEPLGSERPPAVAPVQAPELPLAPPGERIVPPAPPSVPAVDVEALRFDLAEAGAELGGVPRPAAPPAPDVSHLKLVDGE